MTGDHPARARALRVAAAQVESYPAEHGANLARAERWVVEAARRGAQLVLRPELLRAGMERIGERAYRRNPARPAATRALLAATETSSPR